MRKEVVVVGREGRREFEDRGDLNQSKVNVCIGPVYLLRLSLSHDDTL